MALARTLRSTNSSSDNSNDLTLWWQDPAITSMPADTGFWPMQPAGPTGADSGLPHGESGNAAPSLPANFHKVDQLLHSDTARTTDHVDGTGIKIGVLSTGFDVYNHELATAVQVGAVGQVTILQDGSSDSNSQFAAPDDEGLAMAEVIHSIAPNAQIYYYTAEGGTDAMAAGVSALAAAGCNIICDDFNYPPEAFYQENNPTSVAIDAAVMQGIAYFTCATNLGEFSYYENTMGPGHTASVNLPNIGTRFAYTFNNSSHPYLEAIFAPSNANLNIEFQWNQPFLSIDGTGSAYSLNYVLYDNNFNIVSTGHGPTGTGSGIQTGGDPVQAAVVAGPSVNTTYYLAVYLNDGLLSSDPNQDIFKVIIGNHDDRTVQFENPDTNVDDPNAGVGSGAVTGHNADPNAITVGASKPDAPTTMEEFSSIGPGIFLRDTNGNLLVTPLTQTAVDITAPDGNPTTVFPTFFGTSASTPAAAAVGALMLQADPTLTPVDINAIMAGTALALANPTVSGAGLLDALKAVNAAHALKANGNLDAWKTGQSGDFATPANWSLGFVPSQGITAAITVAGTYTVTSKDLEVVGSLNTSKTATLSITDDNGTGSSFVVLNGTGKGASAGTIGVGDHNSTFLVGGTFNNTGSITVGSGGTGNAFLYLPADGTVLNHGFINHLPTTGLTLTGTGTVTLATNAIVEGDSAGDLLTNAGNKIVGAGALGNGFMSLNNQAPGVINATGTMTINTGTDTNAGLMESTNALGVLNLNSAVTNTGTINAVAGVVNINGNVINQKVIEATSTGHVVISSTVNNGTAGIVEALAAGTHVDLNNATIIGGTLATAGGGLIETTGAGTLSLLDGFTSPMKITGAVQVSDNSGLELEGSFTNTGSVTVNSSGDLTFLLALGAATLIGAGKVTMSDNDDNHIGTTGVAAILTNSGNTISGAGTIGDASLLTFVNKSGTVTASGSHALVIDTGNLTVINNGTFQATGTGGLKLESAINNGTTGIIQALTGSHVDLDGAIVEGGTLKVVGTGTINSVGTASLLDGRVNAVKVTGPLNVADNTALGIEGTITNTGTFLVNSTSHETDIFVVGAAILSGAGKVTMTDNVNNHIQTLDSGINTLTNMGNTISGAGSIGDDFMTFVNQTGIVNANGTHTLTIDTGFHPVTNNGTFEATNTGGLVLNDITVNQGTTGITEALTANSHVDLAATTINGGTLMSVAGATIHTLTGGESIINAAVKNAGLLEADSGGRLLITGAVTNSGTAEANASNLTISGAVNNTGHLIADNADLRIFGAVTGAGDATIRHNGVLEFGAASSTKVNFGDNTGELILDSSATFTGKITGFQLGDSIELSEFNSTQAHIVSYSGNTTGGTLTVADNTHTAKIAFLGSYVQGNFHINIDVDHNVFVVDPPVGHDHLLV